MIKKILVYYSMIVIIFSVVLYLDYKIACWLLALGFIMSSMCAVASIGNCGHRSPRNDSDASLLNNGLFTGLVMIGFGGFGVILYNIYEVW